MLKRCQILPKLWLRSDNTEAKPWWSFGKESVKDMSKFGEKMSKFGEILQNLVKKLLKRCQILLKLWLRSGNADAKPWWSFGKELVKDMSKFGEKM